MMKPEHLLEAMNGIDSQLIKNAETAQAVHTGKRRLVSVCAAAAVIAAMGLTVFAASEGWLQKYFGGKSDLSENQKTYIEENVVQVSQPKVSSAEPGITVESAITDGVQLFAKLRLVAPKDVVLRNDEESWYRPGNEDPEVSVRDLVTVDGMDAYNSVRFLPQEDGDGLDNTIDFLVTGMLEGQWDPETHEEIPLELKGKTLKLHIHDFYQYVPNENNGKDAEIDDSSETPFGTMELAVAGDWTFDIPVTDAGLQEVELIREPVKTTMQYMDMNAAEKTFHWQEGIQLDSVIVRSLSLDIHYSDPENSGIRGDFGRKIKVVMKDGGEETAVAQWAGEGVIRYLTNVPVVLEDVDRVVLENGTEIPMPQ